MHVANDAVVLIVTTADADATIRYDGHPLDQLIAFLAGHFAGRIFTKISHDAKSGGEFCRELISDMAENLFHVVDFVLIIIGNNRIDVNAGLGTHVVS